MSGKGKGRKKHGEGSYHLQRKDSREFTFRDFRNPWTFSNLCLWSNDIFFPWLRENGLLSNSLRWHCGKTCSLNNRSKTTDGYSFPCSSGHQFGIRKYSFLQGSSYDIRDLLLLIKKIFRWPYPTPVRQ